MNVHDFNLDLHPLLLGPLAATYHQWSSGRQYSAIFLVADEHTWAHCAPVFWAATGLSPQHTTQVIIPAGEQHKNLETCQQIWAAMLGAGLDRQALVVNLGGGVVGDMGGFCAATFKRGIDFLQIPTTLLAATDASVGGKTGIDFQGVKNIIGSFANPAGVLVDPLFFRTLPDRELRSGFAEIIKHAAIGDAALWSAISHLHDLRGADWQAILKASIQVKVEVVRQDPLEKGLRAVLNYGHTIGHAVESYFLETDHPLTHGEAVAYGMLWETIVREKKGQSYAGAKSFLEAGALAAYLNRFFPQIYFPNAHIDQLWTTMQHDKKNTSGRVRLALPGNAPYALEWLYLECEDLFIEG